MKDVAMLAGVSLATVSRVVNGEASVRADLADERLFARLDGDRDAVRRIVVPTALIERGSGELRP